MYRDALETGCDVNPVPFGCLRCPLPLCRYDDPQGYENWQRKQKRAELKVTVVSSMAVREAAQRLGVTERTVYRIIAREREMAE